MVEMRRRAPALAVLLALLALAAVVVRPRDGGDPGGGRSAAATVVRSVDGDTIRVQVDGREQSVRLLGIDTPETHRPGTPIECGGPQASAFMEKLVRPGTRVVLESDPTQDSIDRYGRMLA